MKNKKHQWNLDKNYTDSIDYFGSIVIFTTLNLPIHEQRSRPTVTGWSRTHLS